jgi:hypothetical protein
LEEIEENATCIIYPHNTCLTRWQLFVSILLIYTAIAVPIKVGFGEQDSVEMILFDTAVDTCFLIDLVLQFFSALERPDGTYEIRHDKIAIRYLKLWFWIDFFSSVPTQILELINDDKAELGDVRLE